MAIFGANQVGQFYLAKKQVTAVADLTAKTAAPGDTMLKQGQVDKSFYLTQVGMGGIVRSDLVGIKEVESVKGTSAKKLQLPLRRQKIILDPTVNGGLPISGQDYLLRLIIKNYIGFSDEDWYIKEGCVHAVAAMTASAFYVQMALSLAINFQKEAAKIFSFYLTDGTTETEVLPKTKAAGLTGTFTGIVIEEYPQEWILGMKAVDIVKFECQTPEVTLNGDTFLWGIVSNETPKVVIGNGERTADMEYYFMGERGDRYRKMGYPYIINQKYMVDPTLEYDFINIHYAFTGDNSDNGKSEKDMIIAVPATVTTGADGKKTYDHALANKFITSLNGFGLNAEAIAD